MGQFCRNRAGGPAVESAAFVTALLEGLISGKLSPGRYTNPTGKHYSTAFEMTLDMGDLGKSRSIHFNRANAALQVDANFAKQLEKLIPGAENAVSRVGGRQTPVSWIWHHENAKGVMRLTPAAQHTPGSIFSRALHPSGRGGYSIWAIPRRAPPNR